MNQIFALGTAFILLSTSTSGCIQNYFKGKQPEVQVNEGTTITPPGEDGTLIPEITQQEIDNGFYYSAENQKKPGTPGNWTFVEAGRSSMWKAPVK
jgi:hypothetical protein